MPTNVIKLKLCKKKLLKHFTNYNVQSYHIKWFSIQKHQSACRNNLDFLFGLPNMLRQRQYKKQLQFDDIADIKKNLMTGLNQPTPLTFCPENHL